MARWDEVFRVAIALSPTSLVSPENIMILCDNLLSLPVSWNGPLSWRLVFTPIEYVRSMFDTKTHFVFVDSC